MALDHANYFVAQTHSSGEYWGGPFPSYSAPLPFLTRLVTHACAPGFFFLMGAGMLLFSEARRVQGWKHRRVLTHFLVRGMLLIALQLLVVNLIWRAGPGTFPETYIGVLFALGGAMHIGSAFLQLNSTTLLVLTLALLVWSAWLHPAPELWGRLDNSPWKLILLRSGGDGHLWSNYPILPWLALTTFGMLFGRWLIANEQKAYQKGLWMGLLLLLAFTILRFIDGFGTIRPRAGDSWIDFLNVVKYPPSLAFTCLTMGGNLLWLWTLARSSPLIEELSRFLVVFGREPLFVYILHLALYLGLGRLFTPGGSSPIVMMFFWALGIAILFPLALWYGRFKQGLSRNEIVRLL